MTASRTLIVGSGVAAVATARRILTRDKSAEVLVLEAGGDFQIPNYRKWLDFVMTRVSPTRAFEDEGHDADINSGGGFTLAGGRMIVRGGSTNHWGGWCPRMKPEDFRLGEARKGALNWPISYDDLAPYYTEAEVFLGVCGDSKATSTPRHGDSFPFAPVPFTALDGLLMPALERLGFGYEALPIARDPRRCRTTGTCRFCPFDARYAAGSDLSALLREFPGRIELRLDSPVFAIEMADEKKAIGARHGTSDGKVITEPADRVVLAAGTIESAKLLLASRNGAWPKGLGNNTGHVGKYIVTHPLLRSVAVIPKNNDRLEQEIDFPTMTCRHFDSEKYQPKGKMFFVRDGKYVVIPIADRLLAFATPKQVEDEIESSTRIELRALIEAFPGPANAVSLANGSTRFGLPRTKIQYQEAAETVEARRTHMTHLLSVLQEAGLKELPQFDSSGARSDHATSTCRMADSAAAGVVDENLQVHDTDNVFICSNAVFPNAGAVNPTLTLVALALRLGDFITSKVGQTENG